jgi:hypothetical protein
MAGWTPLSPWKIIAGSGQTLSVTTSDGAFTNALGAASLGAQTRAFAISLEPTATATGATVRVTNAGTAATAALDFFIKTTDPPMILGCLPGDKVHVIGVAACTAHLCELTH